MSVSSLYSFITYTTDGINGSYPIPYYFINQQDILVQSVDSTNNIITYNLNSDYQIAGIQNLVGDYPNGATVNFNNVPAANLTLLITRVTQRTQEVLLVDNGLFTAEIINHVHDKLMLLIQEGFVVGYLGMAFGPPTSSQIAYKIGDWFKNANPVGGGVFGWVCTQAGPPGTWNGFGLISF